jgi:hypothetical protein
VQSWGQLDESCRLRFNADGKEIDVFFRSTEHLLEIYDVVLRLLAASVVHSVILNNWRYTVALTNAPTLAYLMEQCQSLKALSLYDVEMDESHCRVLGDFSKPGLEIALHNCEITSAGASALAEVLRRNQGPTQLDRCEFDYSFLANGLRGNSRLKSLRPRFSSNLEVGNREFLAIATALRENKGLVDLDLWPRIGMSDETLDIVCDSLETHPTLEILHLLAGGGLLAPAVLTSRMQVLVDMMKVNMLIHTLHLPHQYSEHEIFRGSVTPYLETNRLRPRLLAIQKTRPIAYRAKVPGRALLSARTDANRFWMLLSENPEVAFPSTLATTTPAANLPTPADATSNAATATAAVTVTATRAASTTGTSTDANAATPTDCQKRKAHP